jgi:cysteine desulfurase
LLAAVPMIAMSTGSACRALHEEASAVIVAMGVPPMHARGSVRLTLGRQTTSQDVETAAAALVRGWHELGAGTERERSTPAQV